VSATADRWSQDDFHVQRWGIAEGLPGNHISALAQDRHGFLWLATMAGLVRFDGVSFQVFNETSEGLPTSRITALDAGPSGRLWIGTEAGHIVVKDGDRFRVVAEPQFPGFFVAAVAEASDGSVWYIHTDRTTPGEHPWLWHWTGDRVRPRYDLQRRLVQGGAGDVHMIDSPGGIGTTLPVLYLDPDGRARARMRGGVDLGLGDPERDRVVPDVAQVHLLGPQRFSAQPVADAIELVDEHGRSVARLPREPARLRAVWLQDRRGLVWASTIDGLEVHAEKAASAVAAWDLESRVLDVVEDREGNVWVATRMQGLIRIQPSAVRQLDPGDGTPLPAKLRPEPDGSAVMSIQVLQPDPELAVPRYVYRLPRDGSPPVAERIYWQRTDSKGRRWRFGGNALRRLDLGPTAPPRRLERGFGTLNEDPSDPDTFWASAFSTFVRLRIGSDGVPEIDREWPIVARSLPLLDPTGGVWVGAEDGLHRIRDDRHTLFDRDDGLPVNEVRALHRDAAGDLWLGTYGGGLVRYDGRTFGVVAQRHGLVENFVSSIVADDFGALWMSGNRGIQRVLKSDLAAFLDGRSASVPSVLFGIEHGLDNPEAIGPHSGVRVGDRLYFSTFGGLAVIDPAVVAARERHRPQVHLFDPSGERRITTGEELEVAPDRDGFELRASAIHLSAPETLRFRHRLIGHRADWIDNGAAADVSYAGLPPGEYRLEVQARHSGGPWIGASALPQITVLPFWWETGAARAAGLVALAGATIFLWLLANRHTRNRARALEATVAERTRDLERERDTVANQAGRLRELADGRARFIAGISHELRTPLTLIRGPLDALAEAREADAGRPPEKTLQQARENVERLQALIDRLLESARLEGGAVAIRVREVDLSDWLTELARRVRPLFEERGSSLVAEIPGQRLPAWIDPVLMDSAITNLLVNALRHGDSGGTATLSVKRDADGWSVIDVIDDGPGIAPAHREHVFERFYRARGEQSRGSYGLGLWLVRQIVERHRGTVELLDYDGGAHFRVRLAAGREHFEDAEIGGEPAEQSARLLGSARDSDKAETREPDAFSNDVPTILVVDDHAGIRALVRDALGRRCQVTEAADGQAALDAVRLRLPDVIVSDIMMPRVDGIELLSTLRGDPETDFLPFVLLTAKTGDEDRIAGLEHGADAYLDKPFDRRELRAVVEGLLAQQKRLRVHLTTATGAVADAPEPDRPAWAPDKLSEKQRVFLNRFQAAVEARIADEDLAIDDLAEALGQSRATLYRKLKQAAGRSPSELIREIRLARARSLLERGAGSVSEVGYAVGFKSVAHFSNTFQARFGVRPSEFGR